MLRTGWDAARYGARSFEEARRDGTTCVTDDADGGDRRARGRHRDRRDRQPRRRHPPRARLLQRTASTSSWSTSRPTCSPGRCWPERAREAGIVYSLAYGDQPALIAELVDWARAAGFEVVAAGKGTKYLPAYHESTPATRLEPLRVHCRRRSQHGDINAQMFNSFLDGTKSAIEMAAVANASGLRPRRPRPLVSALRRRRSAAGAAARGEGGQLHHDGQVEVVSSLERDGRPVFRDLRWGVYVVFRRRQRLRAAPASSSTA